MSREQEINELLRQTGPGRLTNSAYDAGWVARLGDVDAALSGAAMEWLRRNQLPDGTWGASTVVYHHDRAICTLSAVTALARYGDKSDRVRINAALPALRTSLNRLDQDVAGETIGFELLAPALLAEARELGLVDAEAVLTGLCAERDRKLSFLSPGMVNNRTALVHSAEMAGPDDLHLLDLENMVHDNGSVGFSPAATAFYATVAEKHDSAVAYLGLMSDHDGGVPNVGPVDVFEMGWTLWNVGLTAYQPQSSAGEHQRLLSAIRQAWTPARGASFGAGFIPEDGDDTAVAYEVLVRYGGVVDAQALLSYAGPDYFYTWSSERNPSVSTNIHALGALRAAGMSKQDPMIQMVLRHLAGWQHQRGHWVDKWHASPYYPTAHAVVAGYPDDMFGQAVGWIIDSQRADGSWGHFLPTAEETAYCLQALTFARRGGHRVPRDVIHRGHEWLTRNAFGPHPWLWIGKCLYSTDIVVRSVILSALALVEEDK